MKDKKHGMAASVNALLVEKEGWNNNQRESKATGELTSVMNALATTPGRRDAILKAIDEGDETAFLAECGAAGLAGDLAQRVWDATMGSLDPQAAKPC